MSLAPGGSAVGRERHTAPASRAADNLPTLETTLAPRGPFSLARSARGHVDGTRLYRDGVLRTVFEAGGQPAAAAVWQLADGRVRARIASTEPEAAHERLRFLLALDVDVRPFLEIAGRDRLLGDLVRRGPGLRPMRVGTVAHALLRAVAGQLVTWSRALAIERALVVRVCRPHAGFRLPPTAAEIGGIAPAQAVACGLAARRAAALVRVSRELDLERLRAVPSDVAARRIERERGLGPWSAGMIGIYGLGSVGLGLVGDLGLIKLCRRLLGRQATPEDTRALLAPYGEWAGLASLHLLRHPLAG